MSDVARQRAADALDLPGDAGAGAARARFLAKLPTENFLPPNDWIAALGVLGVEMPLTAEAIAEREAFERAALDAFLAEYWSLDPAARREQWELLKARSHSPGILARLQDVSAGLGVKVTSFVDAEEEQIAQIVRECYLLAPRARAARRAEWIAEREDFNIWKAAAIRFREADPATAALEPVLLDYLLRPHTAPRIVAALSDEQLRKIAARRERKIVQALRQNARPRQEEKSRFSFADFNLGSYWWVGLVAAVVLRGCVALVGNSSTRSSSTVYPVGYPANPSPPSFQQNPPNLLAGKKLDLSTMFTPEELAAFEAYDPKSLKPAPPRYTTWRLMGGRPQPPGGENP